MEIGDRKENGTRLALFERSDQTFPYGDTSAPINFFGFLLSYNFVFFTLFMRTCHLRRNADSAWAPRPHSFFIKLLLLSNYIPLKNILNITVLLLNFYFIQLYK